MTRRTPASPATASRHKYGRAPARDAIWRPPWFETITPAAPGRP